MRFVLIYMTASDDEEANRIAKALVEKRLAACVNVLGHVTSHFRWNEAIDQAKEVALTAKTSADLVPALEACVAELHSYECPCIVALPIEGGHGPFLQWIAAETEDVPG